MVSCMIRNGEAWLLNVHISPYDFGNRENHEPRRERRLLLHRQEIRKLHGKVAERGWTIVPLRMYLKDGLAKVEIALVRGKRLYDKKDAVAERDMDRELRRADEGRRLRMTAGRHSTVRRLACLHIRQVYVRITS